MSSAFQPLSLQDLADLKIPPTEYIIEDLLPAGSLTLNNAREKAGKGLITIDACASVAFEEPFLDRATRGGPAIYVAAEESIQLVRERVLHRVESRRDGPFLVLPLNGFTEDRLRLDDPIATQRLLTMIEELDPIVVVLDTLRELHDLPENDSDAMGPLIRPLREIAHNTGCAIVLNHHQNKQNSFRGSTAILAACDQEWSFQRTDGDDSPTPTGSLTVKGRFGPKIVVHMTLGDAGRWAITSAPYVGGDSGLRGRIIEAVRTAEQPPDAREIHRRMTEPKPELKTVQNALSAMMKEASPPFARIGSAKKTDPWRYLVASPGLAGFDGESPQNGSFPSDDQGGRDRREPSTEVVPGDSWNIGNHAGNHLVLRRSGEV